jgi:2-desacetyl-2-hydroxyethyl bacteriochlorophyllide A dehydrogenase
MQALWLEDKTLTLRDDVPVPSVPRGSALIQVLLAGICSTDLELVKGYYPYRGVPGHEFVGKVVKAPGRPSWMGQRVVGEINIACGMCQACRTGLRTHCEQRAVLGIVNHDGAFAEYVTLPLKNLHRVPRSIPDEAAVFTEPLAAALQIGHQVQLRPTDRVLIVGAGRLGQLVAQVLALTGCELQIVARHETQRALLGGRNITPTTEDAVPCQKMDVVVEATGSPRGFSLALQAVRPRGKIVLKSTYRGGVEVNFSPIVVNEITLVGSRCGPFASALRLLAGGVVDPTPLIVSRYPLSKALSAFEHASRPGVLKVLLEPTSLLE